jgi:hypothetical protein
MAAREHLRCVACGSMRPVAEFQKEHEALASTQFLAGRNNISWDHRHLTEEDARLMLKALRDAAARLEAGLAQTERG